MHKVKTEQKIEDTIKRCQTALTATLQHANGRNKWNLLKSTLIRLHVRSLFVTHKNTHYIVRAMELEQCYS